MEYEPSEQPETEDTPDGDDMIDVAAGVNGGEADITAPHTDDADVRNDSERRRRHAAWIAFRCWI